MINTRVASEMHYYDRLRMPLLSLARGTPKRVLEIGCAEGQSLAYFKSQGADFVAGVELSPQVAEVARHRPEVDDVIVGNIENLVLNYPTGSFDLLVMGHVIEHLADPWETVRKLKLFLKPGGQFIGAVPNVRHYKISLPLVLAGSWKYRESGVLDWTHLRFFSLGTIQELLLSTGFTIDSIVPELASPITRSANAVTLNLFRHFLSYAYNFSATRPL